MRALSGIYNYIYTSLYYDETGEQIKDLSIHRSVLVEYKTNSKGENSAFFISEQNHKDPASHQVFGMCGSYKIPSVKKLKYMNKMFEKGTSKKNATKHIPARYRKHTSYKNKYPVIYLGVKHVHEFFDYIHGIESEPTVIIGVYKIKNDKLIEQPTIAASHVTEMTGARFEYTNTTLCVFEEHYSNALFSHSVSALIYSKPEDVEHHTLLLAMLDTDSVSFKNDGIEVCRDFTVDDYEYPIEVDDNKITTSFDMTIDYEDSHHSIYVSSTISK